MDVLLDFSRPLDVALLDQAVMSMVSADGKQNKAVEEMIVTFQNHALAWTRVDSILEKSTNSQTRLIALNILEQTVKYKWNALPANQRDGIKNFIVNLIIKLSSDPDSLRREAVFLKKLNLVLIAVVKQEWPHNWPNFIPELVNSSKTSQSLCANNMQILLLLSEEIFDYGSGQMTLDKMRQLKSSLNQQFTLIYQLCDYILDKSRDATLISTTLQTLLRFLHWIPVGFIFETTLIPTLCVKFFPLQQFQNDTLACLSEIGGLKLSPEEDVKYGRQYVQLFFAVVQQVQKLIVPTVDLAVVYHKGNSAAQMFIRHLALFITSFLKAHLNLLEQTDDSTRAALLTSLHTLLRISKVEDQTIFKICLEYWNILVIDLYESSRLQASRAQGAFNSPFPSYGLLTPSPLINPRLKMYLSLLSELRVVMIGRMAKPEEILIVEDEAGQIVRETTQDTDALTVYKSMRECLIYLTHLDPVDAQDTMLNKLVRQLTDEGEYSWHNLNTLCVAAGTPVQVIGGMARPIEELTRPSESVLSYDDQGIVVDSLLQGSVGLNDRGVKGVVRVTMADGRFVDCTADHLIMSQQGWKQAGDLNSRDGIVTAPDAVVDSVGHDEPEARFFSLPLGESVLQWANEADRQRCLALARLSGLLSEPQSLSCPLSSTASFATMADFQHFVADFSLAFSCAFAAKPLVAQRVSAPVAADKLQLLSQSFPLIHSSSAPLALQREFLAAALARVSSLTPPVASALPSSSPSSLEFSISAGLRSSVLRQLKALSVPCCDSAGAVVVSDLPAFSRAVGFRYHASLQYQLSLVCAYIRSSSSLDFPSFLEAAGAACAFSPVSPDVSRVSVFLLSVSSVLPLASPASVFDLSMAGNFNYLINSLCAHNCWAIGSISGALGDQQEKTFLVKVIKDLLQLVELKRGKDHKAVIASNIMYVVGQYPRFLRQHWKFLKTVVNKLFEFMHESHPGVQDMSVETFLKIARRCRKKFVALQQNESRPFIEEICELLPITIRDLEPQQIRVFYEACGEIISSEGDPIKRQQLIFRLMELPNQSWTQIITMANAITDSLWDAKTVKQVVLVLQTNSRVAGSLKHAYLVQLARIYVDMLQVYRMYSGYVSAKIAKEALATGTAEVRQMRAVKKETLNLIRIFVSNSADSDRDTILKNFIPALLEPVLEDYKKNTPDARESEVLSLFAEIVNRVGEAIISAPPVAEMFFPRLFDCVFQCTLDMITRNLQDFPDHRIQFFRLLQAINSHAFPALLRLSPPQFQLIVDAMIWAMKHLERNIADTGLQILFDLLANVANSEVANQFYAQYYISLLSDLLGLLTDTFHKPGFRLQTMILAQLFSIIHESKVAVPLWNSPNNPLQGQSFSNNQAFVSQFTAILLGKAFPNLNPQRIEQFVMGLFAHHNNILAFKNHVRDFLVEMREFSATGQQADPSKANSDLYLEESQKAAAEAAEAERNKIASVPGLMYRDKGGEYNDPDDDYVNEVEENDDTYDL